MEGTYEWEGNEARLWPIINRVLHTSITRKNDEEGKSLGRMLHARDHIASGSIPKKDPTVELFPLTLLVFRGQPILPSRQHGGYVIASGEQSSRLGKLD